MHSGNTPNLVCGLPRVEGDCCALRLQGRLPRGLSHLLAVKMTSQSTDKVQVEGLPVATAPSAKDDDMKRDFELEKLKNEMRREAETNARMAALEQNRNSQGGGNMQGKSNPTVVVASSTRYCGWKTWLCFLGTFCICPCIVCCPLDEKKPSVVVAG